jgi:hypothetical protein
VWRVYDPSSPGAVATTRQLLGKLYLGPGKLAFTMRPKCRQQSVECLRGGHVCTSHPLKRLVGKTAFHVWPVASELVLDLACHVVAGLDERRITGAAESVGLCELAGDRP